MIHEVLAAVIEPVAAGWQIHCWVSVYLPGPYSHLVTF
jgi:hypothetical protein